MFKILSDERLMELSREIANSNEYKESCKFVSNKRKTISKLIEHLPEQEQIETLITEIEEAITLQYANSECFYYEKGFKDCMSIKTS